MKSTRLLIACLPVMTSAASGGTGASSHHGHHRVTEVAQAAPPLAALRPHQFAEGRGRAVGAEPAADQRAAQLAAQPRGEPLHGHVQLAALQHASLHLRVQPRRPRALQRQRGPHAEPRRAAERPVPAAELLRRPGDAGERRLVRRVHERGGRVGGAAAEL